MKVLIGHDVAGREIRLDIPRLVESRMLISANSGAGKSYAIRKLLEATHPHVQQIVLDIEDEFHTLREKFDYVLAGRAGGDCPADVRSAALLARRLLELQVSAIVGIYELKAYERTRFVKLFLESLISAPSHLRHPCLVIVDESHILCPQNGRAESMDAVCDLMTRGRKRGLAGVLATQRLAKLHKDAAAEANNRLLGRAAMDVDMRRSADEIGFPRNREHMFRTLKPGTFFAFGPALSEQIIECKIAAVQTTHLRAGQRVTAPVKPSSRVKGILAKLADLPKEAEAEAKGLKELQEENRALKRQIRNLETAAPKAAPDTKALEKARQDAQDAKREATHARGELRRFARVSARASEDLQRLSESLKAISPTPAPEAVTLAPYPPEVRPVPKSNGERPAAAQIDGLTRPQSAIVDALAWLEAVGVATPTRVQVAFVAGASPRSSAFVNNLGALRGRGLLDYPSGGALALTAEGRSAANWVPNAMTDSEYQQKITSALPGPQARILTTLIAQGALEREQLAEMSGASHRSSAFVNNLGRLRGLGFIDYERPNRVKPTRLLWVNR